MVMQMQAVAGQSPVRNAWRAYAGDCKRKAVEFEDEARRCVAAGDLDGAIEAHVRGQAAIGWVAVEIDRQASIAEHVACVPGEEPSDDWKAWLVRNGRRPWRGWHE